MLFTAGLEDYAGPICDAIEARYGPFQHRLYRPATVASDIYPCIKDMSRLGRDLRRCVLVDDTPLAFFRQPDHGIPILQVGVTATGWQGPGPAGPAEPLHPAREGRVACCCSWLRNRRPGCVRARNPPAAAPCPEKGAEPCPVGKGHLPGCGSARCCALPLNKIRAALLRYPLSILECPCCSSAATSTTAC